MLAGFNLAAAGLLGAGTKQRDASRGASSDLPVPVRPKSRTLTPLCRRSSAWRSSTSRSWTWAARWSKSARVRLERGSPGKNRASSPSRVSCSSSRASSSPPLVLIRQDRSPTELRSRLTMPLTSSRPLGPMAAAAWAGVAATAAAMSLATRGRVSSPKHFLVNFSRQAQRLSTMMKARMRTSTALRPSSLPTRAILASTWAGRGDRRRWGGVERR